MKPNTPVHCYLEYIANSGPPSPLDEQDSQFTKRYKSWFWEQGQHGPASSCIDLISSEDDLCLCVSVFSSHLNKWFVFISFGMHVACSRVFPFLQEETVPCAADSAVGMNLSDAMSVPGLAVHEQAFAEALEEELFFQDDPIVEDPVEAALDRDLDRWMEQKDEPLLSDVPVQDLKNLGQSMAGFEEICSVRDHSKGSKNKENKSCAVGLDLQLDVAPQL